jgi:hypothetical protein
VDTGKKISGDFVMDKDLLIKLFAGTILRGLGWGAAVVCERLGTAAPSDEVLEKVAFYAAAVLVAGIMTGWSMVKNKKLLQKTPPR